MTAKRFGDVLREARHNAKKSMGDVARSLGISVVYYSDVENGKRKPFAPGSEYFKHLQNALQRDVSDLESLAIKEREGVRLNVKPESDELTRSVAFKVARAFNDDLLTEENKKEILEFLENIQGRPPDV